MFVHALLTYFLLTELVSGAAIKPRDSEAIASAEAGSWTTVALSPQ